MIEKIFAPPFIVIGMHRSGTSMLSELLSASGIFMGNDLTNDKESGFFQRINIELLNQNNFTWMQPGIPSDKKEIQLSESGMLLHYVRARRNPVLLLKLLSGSKWGWKDPRNTFTLERWLKIFANAKVIHIYRNGIDVALSLYNRNVRLGKEDKWYAPALENKLAAFDLWAKYVEQGFSFQQKLKENMVTIEFENFIAGDLIEIKKLETFTGKKIPSSIAEKEKVSKYNYSEHSELIQYASQNQWMKKLGYV